MPGRWMDMRMLPRKPVRTIVRFERLCQYAAGAAWRASVLCALGLPALASAAGAAEPSPVAQGTAGEQARPCPSASDPSRPRILVTVSGVRRAAGNVTFTLYGDQPGRFLAHKGSIAIERVTLSGLSAQGCFILSGPGVYAVAVYHDENNNHHFDRSLLGLPVEGYGFSNNAPIFLAPPSFGAVRFQAGPADTALSIALRY